MMMDSARKGKGAGRKVSEGNEEGRGTGRRADERSRAAATSSCQKTRREEKRRRGTRDARDAGRACARRGRATWHGTRAREGFGRLVERDAGLARRARMGRVFSTSGDGRDAKSGHSRTACATSVSVICCLRRRLSSARQSRWSRGPRSRGCTASRTWRRTTSPRFRPTQPRRLTPKNGRWTPSARRRENARPKRGGRARRRATNADARATCLRRHARSVRPPAPRMRRGNLAFFKKFKRQRCFSPVRLNTEKCGIFRILTPNWVQKKRTETRTTNIEVWRKVGRIPNLADGEWHRRSAMRRTSQLCSHRSITPTGDPSIRLASYTALFASPPRILRFTRPPPRCTAPRPP